MIFILVCLKDSGKKYYIIYFQIESIAFHKFIKMHKKYAIYDYFSEIIK